MSRRWFAVCLLASIGVACSRSDKARCEVDTSKYESGSWHAPDDAPAPSTLAPQKGESDWDEELSFGGDVHRTMSVLWWPEHGDVELSYRLALGSRVRTFEDARLLVLVDGVQVPLVDADSEEAPFLRVNVDAGQLGEVTGSLREELVSEGTHTLVVCVVKANNGALAAGQVFTAIRERPVFTARPDHASMLEIEPRADFLLLTSDEKPVPPDAPISTVAADGTLPLEFRLQRPAGIDCPSLRVPIVATVLIDFQQVELESFGPFVRADLRVADSAFVRAVVHGPAPGAERHVVTVVHYSGDGLFTEAPPGTYTPWAVLQPGTTGFGTY